MDMAQVTNPADMPDADKDDAIIVGISRDGNVYVGQPDAERPVDRRDQDHISNRIDKTIFIRATGAPNTATWRQWWMKFATQA